MGTGLRMHEFNLYDQSMGSTSGSNSSAWDNIAGNLSLSNNNGNGNGGAWDPSRFSLTGDSSNGDPRFSLDFDMDQYLPDDMFDRDPNRFGMFLGIGIISLAVYLFWKNK